MMLISLHASDNCNCLDLLFVKLLFQFSCLNVVLAGFKHTGRVATDDCCAESIPESHCYSYPSHWTTLEGLWKFWKFCQPPSGNILVLNRKWNLKKCKTYVDYLCVGVVRIYFTILAIWWYCIKQAKGLLSEYQPKFNSARAVYRERKKYVDEIDLNMLAVPPTGSYKAIFCFLLFSNLSTIGSQMFYFLAGFILR